MSRSHIPSFPNRIPKVDWSTYLPKFRDEDSEDAALHVTRFHMHIRKLGVRLHEDSLMKMFMASLEGNARFWYESLPDESLYSLKDFHEVFYKR